MDAKNDENVVQTSGDFQNTEKIYLGSVVGSSIGCLDGCLDGIEDTVDGVVVGDSAQKKD